MPTNSFGPTGCSERIQITLSGSGQVALRADRCRVPKGSRYIAAVGVRNRPDELRFICPFDKYTYGRHHWNPISCQGTGSRNTYLQWNPGVTNDVGVCLKCSLCLAQRGGPIERPTGNRKTDG